MKKIFLFLLFIASFQDTFGDTLEVKSNIPSGNYDSVIEVHLISNDKKAKIFYYTDTIGRMDAIYEYKNPLIIKKNTQLDFYATNANFKDTLIQTSHYTFHYTQGLKIIQNNNTIEIKNTSGDIQNIGYWIIKGGNIHYEIPKNTYLEHNQTYQIQYSPDDNEIIKLFQPDNILSFQYEFKKNSQKVNSPPSGEIPSKTEENQGEKDTPTEVIPENIQEENIPLMEEIISGEPQTSSVLFSPENIKASTLDTNTIKKENNTRPLLIIFGILIIVIFYNIGLFLQKTGKLETFGKKIKKIGKK